MVRILAAVLILQDRTLKRGEDSQQKSIPLIQSRGFEAPQFHYETRRITWDIGAWADISVAGVDVSLSVYRNPVHSISACILPLQSLPRGKHFDDIVKPFNHPHHHPWMLILVFFKHIPHSILEETFRLPNIRSNDHTLSIYRDLKIWQAIRPLQRSRIHSRQEISRASARSLCQVSKPFSGGWLRWNWSSGGFLSTLV